MRIIDLIQLMQDLAINTIVLYQNNDKETFFLSKIIPTDDECIIQVTKKESKSLKQWELLTLLQVIKNKQLFIKIDNNVDELADIYGIQIRNQQAVLL